MTFFIFTISHNSLCYDTTNRVYLVSPPTPPVMLFRQDAPLNFDLLLSALSLGWGGGAKTPNTVGFTVIQALNNDMNLQSFIWTMHLLKVKWQRDAIAGLRTRSCERVTLDSLLGTFKIQLGTHMDTQLYCSLYLALGTFLLVSYKTNILHHLFLSIICFSFPTNLTQQMNTILYNQSSAG